MDPVETSADQDAAESNALKDARDVYREDFSSKLWTLYLSEADKNDKGLMDNMEGNTNGILVFTGLFSATVAAFIIESYKGLRPDSGDTTVALLAQISQQLAAAANGTAFTLPTPPISDGSSFRPPSSIFRVNVLWFLSLVLSLLCALVATLMQQWARRYVQATQGPVSATRRGRVHAYLHQGLQTFELLGAVEALPALLHASVFLFFAGLLEFLFFINTKLAYIILPFVILGALSYLVLTILPIIWLNSPYRTPLSAPLFKSFGVAMLGTVIGALHVLNIVPIQYRPIAIHRHAFNSLRKWTRYLSEPASLSLERAATLDRDVTYQALRWTLQTIDDNAKLEKFVDGLVPFLSQPNHIDADYIVAGLLDSTKLASHVGHLLKTTVFSAYFKPPSKEVRNRRALCCFSFLQKIYSSLLQSDGFRWDAILLHVLPAIRDLCQDQDADIAITASCTVAQLSLACLIQSRSRLIVRLDPRLELFFLLNLAYATQSQQWREVEKAGPDLLRPRDAYRRLGVSRDIAGVTADAIYAELKTDGYVMNIGALARRILPYLALASPVSLAVVWSTFIEIVWYSTSEPSDSARTDLEQVRLEIRRAADDRGTHEFESLVDGELPLGSAMDSSYTRLYDALRPAFHRHPEHVYSPPGYPPPSHSDRRVSENHFDESSHPTHHPPPRPSSLRSGGDSTGLHVTNSSDLRRAGP